MPYSLDDKLVVGITSRALFDLDVEDALFRAQGLAAYRAHQREREGVPLAPGTAFPLVRALLSINDRADERLVEVVVISRNDADSGARILHSVAVAGLDITRAAFTDGRDPWPYLQAFRCNLFLSAERSDVEGALRAGFPAAAVTRPPEEGQDPDGGRPEEVRIAFDGDAVLFDPSSEAVFQQEGLAAFQAHEAERADVPMRPGPFEPFLHALQRIQARFAEEEAPVRTALVTARGAPAHRRVVNTLRAWGVRIDESFFLGGVAKAPVLEGFRPHIFFDDQVTHLETASRRTPSAQVLASGPQQLGLFAATHHTGEDGEHHTGDDGEGPTGDHGEGRPAASTDAPTTTATSGAAADGRAAGASGTDAADAAGKTDEADANRKTDEADATGKPDQTNAADAADGLPEVRDAS